VKDGIDDRDEMGLTIDCIGYAAQGTGAPRPVQEVKAELRSSQAVMVGQAMVATRAS
jgi:hypothetical protein